MMQQAVTTARHGNVAVVTIDNRPVNALTAAIVEETAAAVERACAEEAVRAVVITGARGGFVAGADITMFPRIVAGELPAIEFAAHFARIENAGKPVIAAIGGPALGGGLELAMACHWRVAGRGATLGQPEVKLGLIPGAGGTQRLPRLVGVESALEMCAFGEAVTAERARKLGLVDEVVEGDAVEAALRFAAEGPAVRRTRDLSGRLCAGEAAESLAALVKDRCGRRFAWQSAPLAACDAVAATARMSFDEGMEEERRLFERCLHGEQSGSLIHLFFAERAAGRVEGQRVEAATIERAAVVGAGTMGTGIAMALAAGGLEVLLTDADEDRAARAMEQIRSYFEGAVEKGRMAAGEGRAAVERVRAVRGYEGFESAGLIVEAVYEELALKRRVFGELDEVARAGALLATNTSTLDVDAIAAATKRPESVLGVHFFSPAQVMKLVEVVRGEKTAPEAVATAMALGKRLKKIAVLARNRFGFIGNRVFAPYRDEAIQLVERGATPERVDAAMAGFGMAMGPLAVSDLVGLDVWWLIRQAALAAEVAHTPASSFEEELYKQGRLGQKVRLGWYSYDERRKARADGEVVRLAREYAAWQGIEQREWSEREIRERCLLALMNEGARVLEEGVAQRAGDIDVVFVHGYGFPAWRGGPMRYAETMGWERVRARLEELYDEEGPKWKPART